MAGAVTLLAVTVLSAPAWACGYWFLQDEERDTAVTFLATSIETAPRKPSPPSKKKTFGWFKHEPPAVCQLWKGIALDVRDGQFLRGKKVEGRLEGDTVHVGDRTFQIGLAPILNPKARQDLAAPAEIPQWDVDVRSDGKSVAHGPAMSFAMCDHADSAHKEDEIRQRVACYLILSRLPAKVFNRR